MDNVGVMAAYCDPLCVCVVHCTGRHCANIAENDWDSVCSNDNVSDIMNKKLFYWTDCMNIFYLFIFIFYLFVFIFYLLLLFYHYYYIIFIILLYFIVFLFYYLYCYYIIIFLLFLFIYIYLFAWTSQRPWLINTVLYLYSRKMRFWNVW